MEQSLQMEQEFNDGSLSFILKEMCVYNIIKQIMAVDLIARECVLFVQP